VISGCYRELRPDVEAGQRRWREWASVQDMAGQKEFSLSLRLGNRQHSAAPPTSTRTRDDDPTQKAPPTRRLGRLLSFKRLAPAGTGKVETRPSPTIDLHNAEAAAAGSVFRRPRLRADPVSSAVVRLPGIRRFDRRPGFAAGESWNLALIPTWLAPGCFGRCCTRAPHRRAGFASRQGFEEGSDSTID
jgi:hypothetical protein